MEVRDISEADLWEGCTYWGTEEGLWDDRPISWKQSALSTLFFQPHWTLPEELSESPLKNRISRAFDTPGYKYSPLQIGGINGINTTFQEAQTHASCLQKLCPNQSIHWTYNQTHGLLTDIFETLINFLGISPNTSELLQNEWLDFHDRNQETPEAKYLQFCHSQGAIHTRNALLSCPKHIRDRVIVIAIAPGVVIEKNLCHQAFHYMSQKDVVHYAELGFAAGLVSSDLRDKSLIEQVLKTHEQLVFLEPHQRSSIMDHEFQSPTFASVIQLHLEQYLNARARS